MQTSRKSAMEDRRRIIIYLPVILAFVLILGIWLGSKMNFSKSGETQNPIFNRAAQHDKITDLINYVEQDYVDSVSREDLTVNAIEGVLDKLDPHSTYIPAEDFGEAEDQLDDNFEGIGIQFRIEQDTIMVIQVIPGGPSEKVGLMAGDRIVMINDSLVAGTGLTSRDAVKQLKGKRGTVVKVGILRRGLAELVDFSITRDVIPTYSIDISYMVNDSVGYVKLSRFAVSTHEEMIRAMSGLLENGMKRLILDLRDNTGGYLQASIHVSDEFLGDKKLIVYTEGNSRPNQYAYATKRGVFEDYPLVILINEASASASEIVAGAIQDNDRGLIVGRRSFGKGLVQEQLTFPDGSAVRLTVARYHTPTGRSIQRPYKEGEKDEYYHELYDRYANGEMENPDSISLTDTVKYYTPAGKVVYGGGGIMPDVYVALATEEKEVLYRKLIHQNTIFQYAFNYTDRERPSLAKYSTPKEFIERFKVDDKLFSDLMDYARNQDIYYTPSELIDSKEKIKTLLKAYIGRNLLDDEAFYPVYHEVDKVFQIALDTLIKNN
ncbi:MAG TPA: S41 family peptidase [Bacteroidales bacterium]|nr:S41 family peptidase [Bacteroidales bacterium]